MTSLPKVSLIVPFYNDHKRLLDRLQVAWDYLRQQPYTWEIIVVDDGSDEDHGEEIQTRYPGIRVLRYTPNRGKGHAVRTGMLAAQGEYRFFTDADMPFGLEPLGRALHYLEHKEFDLVIGDRQVPGSQYHVHQSPLRKLASKIFTSFISRIVVTGVQDTQCGFKGFRGKIAEELFERSRIDGFAFDVELIYISFKKNYDLKRIPVVLQHSAGSTLRLSWHSWVMLGEVFRIKWNHMRGRYD